MNHFYTGTNTTIKSLLHWYKHNYKMNHFYTGSGTNVKGATEFITFMA